MADHLITQRHIVLAGDRTESCSYRLTITLLDEGVEMVRVGITSQIGEGQKWMVAEYVPRDEDIMPAIEKAIRKAAVKIPQLRERVNAVTNG